MTRTEDYYNLVSDYLVSDNMGDHYYNGSLIIDDIDSDPNTFIEQDVNNVIKLSSLGNNVLELGCGSGYFFKRLIEKNPNISYQGIDISEKQIKNAQVINPKYKNLFFVVDWNQGLPFEDESFDTLLFLETIGYTKDIEKLLSECYRVLKPGGSLFTKHPGCTDTQKEFYQVVKNNLMPIDYEYGYESDSLGMMMDVNKFITNLKKYNFTVPQGYQIPTVDNSLHIKSFFNDEFKPYVETFKFNSKRLSAKSPSKILMPLEWDNLHNELGKIHPLLCKNFKQSLFKFDIDPTKNELEEVFHPCVVITAYKK